MRGLKLELQGWVSDDRDTILDIISIRVPDRKLVFGLGIGGWGLGWPRFRSRCEWGFLAGPIVLLAGVERGGKMLSSSSEESSPPSSSRRTAQ